MPNVANATVYEAKETYATLLDISQLLGADLDPEVLTICVRLCEAGVNSQSLAQILQLLRSEVANVNNQIVDNNENSG